MAGISSRPQLSGNTIGDTDLFLISKDNGNGTFTSLKVVGSQMKTGLDKYGKIGIPDQTTGSFTYYSTLESARDAAVSGDTIIVYPGTYTVTTTATNGIAKSGVNFYFHPGTIVNKSTSGSIFYDSGFTNPCNVYGYGTFAKTTSVGYIYYNTKSNAVFEAKTVTSSISHCFVTDIGNVRFKVDYATSTAGAVLFMNQSNSSPDNNIRVDMIHWKSTASGAITGGWWYYTNLYVTGNRLESTTSYAVSMYNTLNRININVDLILGVTYGLYTYDGTTSVVNVNCTYITGIQDCNTVSLNGLCGKLNFNGYSFSGGICGDITVAAGSVNTVAGLNVYTGAATTPIVVTGGVLNMYQHKTAYGIIFNITGGIFNLYGTIQAGQISTTSGRIVNGGEMNLYGRFNHGGNVDSSSYYGIWLQSGTLRLHSAIKVGFNDSNGHGILWTGGKLIIEDSSIITTNTLTYPIKALSTGLQLRVNGRLSHNRTEQGSILAGKKHKYKYQTNAVASTGLYCNDGTGGDELFQVTDLTTYNTQALIAARMVTLINASATLDMTASQDNPGTDTYFYVETDTPGYNFAPMGNNNSASNLTNTLIRIGSYAMTEICGGTIIENSNIE